MSNDNGGRFTVLEGGVSRMQFGADEGEAAERHSGPRGYQGPAVDQQSHSAIVSGMHGAGILGTATDATLKPSTMVTVQGVGMQLAMAERMGYVYRDSQGVYREGQPAAAERASSPSPQEEQRQQLEQAAEEERKQKEAAAEKDGSTDAMTPELLAPEVEAALTEAVKDVPGEMLSAALVDVVGQLADGQQVDLARFAAQTGMTDERATQYAHVYTQVLANQADGLFAAEGVDQESFFAWARDQRMPELRRALTAHATARTMSGYRTLIKEFQRKGRS